MWECGLFCKIFGNGPTASQISIMKGLMKRWKDSDVTPEALFWNRREVVRTLGFAGLGTLLATSTQAGPLDLSLIHI